MFLAPDTAPVFGTHSLFLAVQEHKHTRLFVVKQTFLVIATGMQTGLEGQDVRILGFSPALLLVPNSHTMVYEFAQAAITKYNRLSGTMEMYFLPFSRPQFQVRGVVKFRFS